MKQSRQTIYAFIDGQNLNLGVQYDKYRGKKKIYTGWRLDYQRFRRYLANKFRVVRAFIFIGYMKENEKLYANLRNDGYELVFKPTTKGPDGKAKGNIDAELVLHAAAIELDCYDKAVVVSGDGDFCCLYDFLEKKDKLRAILIPNSHAESSLLRRFQRWKEFIQFDREKLEYKTRSKLRVR
jgi:uncharacterized LabA/DUF88 family protein